MGDQVNMTTVDKEKGETNNNKEAMEAAAVATTEEERGGFLKDLEGDKMHVLVLFFLYVLQGIPLGLINAVPLILTDRDVSYKEQAAFSFSSYPFSMKLLWAPLVDSVYVARFGRRKSWLVPVQYLIGFMMIIVSQYVGSMLGDNPENPKEFSAPDISSLTVTFFFLNFLAATQDVAVDGWALTMLKPKNVGYASTCNSTGQTAGWCLGYILFTTLESAKIITFSQFLLFWGIVFLITTTLIAIFKTEKNTSKSTVNPEDESSQAEPELGLIDTYKILWKIVRHPLIPVVALLLFTFGFGFSAAESLTNLKLIERKVPKDKIAMLAIPMIPVKIILTLFVTKFTVGPRPMNVWLISFPFRLFLCLAFVLLVFLTPMFVLDEGGFPTHYYALVIGVFALHRASLFAMFVAIMAFFARISDPAVGGTYMTFLNTLTNLGAMWPASFTLWFVDFLTWKTCVPGMEELGSPAVSSVLYTNVTAISGNVCGDSEQEDSCKAMGGSCSTLTDGYFSLSIACVIIGFLWFVWGFRTVRRLQEVEVSHWRVVGKVDETERRELREKLKLFYFF
jgi:PAT family acetyl-CoA transporter-like MFS transporter 1